MSLSLPRPSAGTSVHAQAFEESIADAVSVEWLGVVFAGVATVISIVFAVVLLRRWHERGRTNAALRYWAIGLLLFFVASSALLIGELVGWNSALFRTFYLFGGALNVPWLAMGSVTINSRDRSVSRWTGLLTLAAIALIWVAAGFSTLITPAVVLAALWALVLRADEDGIRAGSVALIGLFSGTAAFYVFSARFQDALPVDALPEGKELFVELVRSFSVAGNATGSLIVVFGALASSVALLWRATHRDDRDEFRSDVAGDPFAATAQVTFSAWNAVKADGLAHIVAGNVLIALGVLFAGASGGMFSFLGDTAGHAFGFGVGVSVMFAGFLRTTTPFVEAASPDTAEDPDALVPGDLSAQVAARAAARDADGRAPASDETTS